jgi:biotin transport system permease protein
MTVIGLYAPGTSPLHRTAPGVKLLALVVIAAIAVALHDPAALGMLCGLVALGHVVARVPARRLSPVARSTAVLVVAVFALQAWLLGPIPAAVTVLRLVATIGAAVLFTFTTRIDDVVTAVERGVRLVGLRPGRIGLVVGLTLQAIATLSGIATSVREAARARGVERSAVAFAVPFLVRTLRHADELGEALAARGMGDDIGGDEEQP